MSGSARSTLHEVSGAGSFLLFVSEFSCYADQQRPCLSESERRRPRHAARGERRRLLLFTIGFIRLLAQRYLKRASHAVRSHKLLSIDVSIEQHRLHCIFPLV